MMNKHIMKCLKGDLQTLIIAVVFFGLLYLGGSL